MSRSRLGLEAERLGSRLGLGHEGLVSIPAKMSYNPLRPFDDLRYNRRPTCVRVAALIINN